MTHDWNDTKFETRAIHAGQDPDPTTGAIITPIYQTSTYVQDAIGEFKGYEYSRTGNPTRTALEEAIASLEGGAWASAFASGAAATQTLAFLLRPGDHILLSNDTYGGTHRLFDTVMRTYGVEMSVADLSDMDAARAALRDNTKVVWVESPTNPYLRIVDIAGMAELARGIGARLIVDNTFASPYLQQPLALGADLILHSTTKYLGGHSDIIGGAVVGNDEETREAMAYYQNAVGAVPGPMDCWLTLRGMKTLAVRMDRHNENGMRVAEWLQERDEVDTVYYPGLESHPNHDIAARQMSGYSGMVSFTMKGGYEAAARIVEGTTVFTLAESLGGVESLIEHPGKMTHASVAGTEAEVEDTLIRMSVGIENVDDLIADLEQAMAGSTSRHLIGASPSRA